MSKEDEKLSDTKYVDGNLFLVSCTDGYGAKIEYQFDRLRLRRRYTLPGYYRSTWFNDLDDVPEPARTLFKQRESA